MENFLMTMTSRERVLTTLRHEEPDRIPVTFAYETPEGILERYGKSTADLVIRQDIYPVSIESSALPENIRKRFFNDVDLPEDVNIDAWGVATWHSPTGESHGVLGALRNAESIEEIEAFPWPEFDEDPELPNRVKELQSRGIAVTSCAGGSIFEQSWYMLGLEKTLMGLYENPALVSKLFDMVTERVIKCSQQYARAGIDILRLSDDIATQRGMMISPDLWRETIKPRLASVIAAAREIRPDLPVFYHSCGNVSAVIEDLIEVGVTILNPIQPEAMDPFEVKQRYGDRITLWGTIGTQTVMPHFTPDEVRRVVKEYCSILGKGGGYVIGPSHAIKEDVPWENIVAFYNAVEEYGICNNDIQ